MTDPRNVPATVTSGPITGPYRIPASTGTKIPGIGATSICATCTPRSTSGPHAPAPRTQPSTLPRVTIGASQMPSATIAATTRTTMLMVAQRGRCAVGFIRPDSTVRHGRVEAQTGRGYPNGAHILYSGPVAMFAAGPAGSSLAHHGVNGDAGPIRSAINTRGRRPLLPNRSAQRALAGRAPGGATPLLDAHPPRESPPQARRT